MCVCGWVCVYDHTLNEDFPLYSILLFLSVSHFYSIFMCISTNIFPDFLSFTCPVGWGCRIHRPMSFLCMTLNNLMVRFQ